MTLYSQYHVYEFRFEVFTHLELRPQYLYVYTKNIYRY